MSRIRKIIDGLEILDKYRGCEFSAGHDCIYAGPSDPNDVTPEDKQKLDELSWFISGDCDSWSHFT